MKSNHNMTSPNGRCGSREGRPPTLAEKNFFQLSLRRRCTRFFSLPPSNKVLSLDQSQEPPPYSTNVQPNTDTPRAPAQCANTGRNPSADPGEGL